jgi:HEAT repeat protein
MNFQHFMYAQDPRVQFAFWLGLVVVVTSMVLLVAILLMRYLAERRERRHQVAADFWRRVLAEAAQAVPARVPPLPRGDMTGFVDAWNDLQGTADAVGQAGMRKLAEPLGLDRKLALLLERGSFHDRVMAIIAMGHLRSPAHFDVLAGMINDRSPIVSINAARALMRIDPPRAVQMVVPQIVARQDWVEGGIAQMLNEAGPEVVSRELGGAALRVNDEVAPRLVRFLAGVSPEAASPVIRQILGEPHDEHLVSTCLQVMTDPADVDRVRPLLAHPRWHVRMHAAAAIGRLGKAADAQALLPLLADPQWWVRYRTAQAVRALYEGDAELLEHVRSRQEDRYARDILTQVIAEKELGELGEA